jgi:hypothetical protein
MTQPAIRSEVGLQTTQPQPLARHDCFGTHYDSPAINISEKLMSKRRPTPKMVADYQRIRDCGKLPLPRSMVPGFGAEGAA